MNTDDYEHGVVPLDQRKPWLSIAAVWIAIGIDLSGAFLGIALAGGMDFWASIGATMLGSLLLGLLAMACAYVGVSTGFSSAMISRAVFGKIGGSVLALVIAVCLLGWFAVQAGFLGTNAQMAWTELTGFDAPSWIFTLIGGALMVLTALWGYRSISKLSTLAVPLLLALLLLGVILAFVARGTAGLDAPVEVVFTFGSAVSLVMGIFIMGVVLAPDMARWAKTPKHAMAAGFVGFFFGNSIIIVVAIVLARVMEASELVTIYFMLGIGVIAIIVLILAQWTTNTTNIYSAALSFSSLNGRLNRRTLTIIGGVVGTVIAVLGASDYFVPFISAIGIIIAPFGGVYLAAFFTERRTGRFDAGAPIKTVHGWAIGAWILGILTALAAANPADGLGLGLFTLTTIPSLDGIVVGFLAYLVIALIRRRNRGVYVPPVLKPADAEPAAEVVA
ncbi:cytosine permease [Leifsonia kafniensis]|uniref:Cytosine permease n=1 Tax=Leifsonia kafniensis TaxID=475957 RepID=A0ABP7KDF3_9MICO